MEQAQEARDWKRHPWRSLPTWGKWVVGIVGVLFVMGIGAAIGSGGEEDKLKDEVASLEEKLETSEDDRNEADYRAETIEAEKDEILTDARDKADEIVGTAKDELSTVSGKLDSATGELESAEGRLSSTREELSGAEEEKQLSTIPGNGTFQAEVDYLPGTYKSEGGPSCYWATLNSPDNFDIATNENATGPTIAPVTTPYFQTSGCGEWTRVGE